MQSCKEAVQSFVNQLMQQNGMSLVEASEAYQTLLAHFESEDALEEALVLAHPRCEEFIERLYAQRADFENHSASTSQKPAEQWISFFPKRQTGE